MTKAQIAELIAAETAKALAAANAAAIVPPKAANGLTLAQSKFSTGSTLADVDFANAIADGNSLIVNVKGRTQHCRIGRKTVDLAAAKALPLDEIKIQISDRVIYLEDQGGFNWGVYDK